MKRNKPDLPEVFVRGMVVGGLTSLFQSKEERSASQVLKLALQGGAALATGTLTARALRQGDYSLALSALMGGALSLWASEKLSSSQALDFKKEKEIG